MPTKQTAARFLMQATLGAGSGDIERACSAGLEGWIEEQFQVAPSVTHEEVHRHRAAGEHYEMHHAWWRQVLTADDLLRQRIAVALTDVFVVSEMSIEFVPWEMMKYYDDLGRLAFGNWRDILRMVSLSPLTGYYLSHLRNRKADPALQRYPDENYAREIMQLFSIGLWELEQDGTRRRDAEGREIPTYGNADVMNFARVFTGLAYGGPLADTSRPADFMDAPADFGNPMKLWEEEHDRDAKRLLRGFRTPSFADAPGRRGIDDIEDALDNLFYHPNVGPFFGRLLIQRLVTSNPSAGFVGRVAAAFENNGRAVRGDMKAVIKAVLLDEEAVNPPADRSRSGRLHEPYLRYVRLARTFNARSADGSFRVSDHDTLESMNQILLNAPSVFNFFLPDYRPPGALAEAGLCAPEFQIMTSSTAVTSLNHYARMVSGGFGDDPAGPGAMRLDFSEELAVAGDPDALIGLLDLKLACGALGEETRAVLRAAYAEMPEGSTAEDRVRAMVQLVAISPDCAVME